MSAPRRLLVRLRERMAASATPLADVVRLVAAELVSEVCSVYAMRPGDIMELAATEGLNRCAIGRTRLRVGEGIVGLAAATGQVLNLPDAQNHPAFAYRPELGEELFASLVAVPVRRAGRTLGVLTLQNRAPRQFHDDEVEVLQTVAMLLAGLLAASGAADGMAPGAPSGISHSFAATPLVPGIAAGVVVLGGMRIPPGRLLAEDPDAELQRLDLAAQAMRQGLDALFGGLAAGFSGGLAAGAPTSGAPREVLAAYRLIADDRGWLLRVADIVRGGFAAEAAVQRVMGEMRDRMRRIADPYLRERLADIEDLAGRLIAALGGDTERPALAAGAILLARRLGPAELLDWHARGIVGLVVEEATPAGHAAIIARALGLPTVGAVQGVLEVAEDGDPVVLDADDGHVILRPEPSVRDAYDRALVTRGARQAGWEALRHRPCATADGQHVTLQLNAGLVRELDQLDATGAEGIGLFRTEILMLARGGMAEVAEQTALYARVLEAAGERTVVFRTFDLGGDKLLPGSPAPEQENPAMGWRSLRVALDRPMLLRRQLRALLRAADGRNLSVMFPMVATVAEFRAARALLRMEAARMQPAPGLLAVGTMLEVPSLLWQLPALLAEVDFVSVGTNDLLQFLFAADRGTPGLAGRYDLLSPPVLDLFDHLVAAARQAGKPVSVCGEAAGRPLEAMALVALGIGTLSMSAGSVLPLKALLAALDLGRFRRFLATLRARDAGTASLRPMIEAWAVGHGLPI